MAEQRKLRLFRGTRAGGELKEYEVAAGEGMVVLDAVHAIQADQAPDLAEQPQLPLLGHVISLP